MREGDFIYLALYRKYRPRVFADVISQPHITKTLTNQLKNKQTSHAYLFTGSRGTGKTTCAKILAQALNCEHLEDGNPCLVCGSCRTIEDGTTDIVEIDAASNNGVDDVRALREEIAYLPVSCKYRVYIIDEVHMLSASAFNALLKTLEEPPEHVVFILATTENHKVPATVLSRCQRFEFHRIRLADSAERLMEIAVKENVGLDKSAAELISALSDGGMRDALSLLDTCLSLNTHVTVDVVRDCAGVAGNKHLFELSAAIKNSDCAQALSIINDLHMGSKDMARLIIELITHYRNLMMLKLVPDSGLAVIPEEKEKYADFAENLGLSEIMRILDILIDCSERISRIKDKKTTAEICMVRLCEKKQATDVAALSARIESLEQYIAGGNIQAVENAPKYTSTQNLTGKREEPDVSEGSCGMTEHENTDNKPEKEPINTNIEFRQWGEVLGCLPGYISGLINSCEPIIDGGSFILKGNELTKSVIDNKNNSEEIKNAVLKVTGKTYEITHVVKDSGKKSNTDINKADAFLKKISKLGITVKNRA